MEGSFTILLASTFVVGCVHTLIGPDHTLPFIALSRSRNWSFGKTMGITMLCGAGHILSALVLGIIAVTIGNFLTQLEFIETLRGEIAAWALTVFGFLYCIWGIRSAVRKKGHIHPEKGDGTPWILFLIFVFGPCEPLIPLVLYPAVQQSLWQTAAVIAVFGIATLGVMAVVVGLSSFGLKKIKGFPFFERYGNALAGGVIGSCGLAMTMGL